MNSKDQEIEKRRILDPLIDKVFGSSRSSRNKNKSVSKRTEALAGRISSDLTAMVKMTIKIQTAVQKNQDSILTKPEIGADTGKASKILDNMLSFMQKSREQDTQEFDTQSSFNEMNAYAEADRHKEVMDVFIQATKKKRAAEKNMAKESKKRKVDVKKEEKKPEPAKKGEPPKKTETKPAETPKQKETPKEDPKKGAADKARSDKAAKDAKDAADKARLDKAAKDAKDATDKARSDKAAKDAADKARSDKKPTAEPVEKVKPSALKEKVKEGAKTAARAGAIVGVAAIQKGLLMPGAEAASAIDNASKLVGVDRALMYAMAKQESGFNPAAGAKTSSAKGLYQFISGTWAEMVKRYGTKYPILNKGPYDPEANAIAGALFIKDNSAILAKSKIPINATNIYAAHFLGASGATTLLTANPDADATKLMPKAAAANEYIFYKTSGKQILKDQPKTVSQVVETLFQKVGQYQEKYSQVLNASNVGSQLDETSQENSDIKKDLSQQSSGPTILVNQNNINNQQKTVVTNPQRTEELNPTMRR